ncbi:DUF4192 domain-containing protein [Nocardioides sp. JQ2195]|uniref:DUF4192 domain-containing protein n=1 Tax=Nocardioides sp. JQ2195 TaxID=2592334 RepID=UPI00143E36A8|nr:DUF4192 domain-containing protein [Nocardioides sp. JQ2195]QIX26431.1 DUF4192 domain-containing protein [Nocardioides sp. JQ2195]
MTTPQHAPKTLRARTPEDLLAMVPYILGFRPDQSLVMLTFGSSGPSFHARVDLPRDPAEFGEVVELLVEPACRHRVERVVVLGYSDDPEPCDEALELMALALLAEGIEVVELLRVTGSRWSSLMDRGHPSGRRRADAGTEFDDRTHPFTVQGVVEGRVTLDSREELADSLVGTDFDAVEAVAAAVEAWSASSPDGRSIEAQWVQDVVAGHVAGGTTPTTSEIGRLLVACRDLALRDVAWGLMSRETSEQHVELWREVLRRTPAELQAAPASLLGFAAWLAGHGALAWCAVDRAVLADPDYSMATLLGDALDRAVPPSSWEPMTDLAALLRGR